MPDLPQMQYQVRVARHLAFTSACVFLASMWVAIPGAIWLATKGPWHMTDQQSTLVEIGTVTGLTGITLLSLVFVVQSQIQILEDVIGRHRLSLIHRYLGVAGSALMLAASILHICSRGAGSLSAIFELLGVLLCATAAVLAVPAIRRMLAPQMWQLLHHLPYIGFILMLPAILKTPLLKKYEMLQYLFLTAFILLAVVVIYFRFVVPYLKNLKWGIKVAALRQVDQGTVAVFLEGKEIETSGIMPGRFVQLKFGSKGLKAKYYFMVTAWPETDVLEILVPVCHAGFNDISQLQVGQQVKVFGPFGKFSHLSRTSSEGIVVLGAGKGVMGVRAILQSTPLVPEKTTVFLRAKTQDEVLFRGEIAHYCGHVGGTLMLGLGPRAQDADTAKWLAAGWTGGNLQNVVPDLAKCDLYVCGPQGWIAEVLADAQRAEVPISQIHVERFEW